MRPLLALLGLTALAACGAAPTPPPASASDAAPPVVETPRDACSALQKPLHTLRVLAAGVGLGRSMPVRPLRPELFVAELDADAARARAAGAAAGDAELGKLAADTAARLTRIAGGARALAAAGSEVDAEAARTSLLEEMERGELVVAIGEQRCGGGESAVGHISASALQRAVRAGAGAFKRCYEPALRRAPDLHGTVRVRFTVARDGAVSEAADADRGPPDPLAWGTGANATPLGDAGVIACVLAAFRKLVFPRPEGGTFSATYTVELDRVR